METNRFEIEADPGERGVSHIAALVKALIKGATLEQVGSKLAVTFPGGTAETQVTHLRSQMILAIASEPWGAGWEGHPDAGPVGRQISPEGYSPIDRFEQSFTSGSSAEVVYGAPVDSPADLQAPGSTAEESFVSPRS